MRDLSLATKPVSSSATRTEDAMPITPFNAQERGRTSETLVAPGAKPDGALLGLARLMTMAFEGVDLAPLAATLIERASADDANALMDLSTILQLQGSRSLGLATQVHALKARRLYELVPAARPGFVFSR
jgi:hypothetical protein